MLSVKFCSELLHHIFFNCNYNCKVGSIALNGLIELARQNNLSGRELNEVLIKVVPGLTHEKLDPFFVERDPDFLQGEVAAASEDVEQMAVPLSEGKLIVKRKAGKTDFPGVRVYFEPKAFDAYPTHSIEPLAVIDECTPDNDGHFGLMATLYNAGDEEPAMAPFHFRLTPPRYYIKDLVSVAINQEKAGLCSYNRAPHLFVEGKNDDRILVAVPWLSTMWDSNRGTLAEGTKEEKTAVTKAAFLAVIAEAEEKGGKFRADGTTAEHICWALADAIGWTWDTAPF